MTMGAPVSSQQQIRDLTKPTDVQHTTASEHTFAMRTRSFIRAWGSAMALAALGLVLWEVLVRVLKRPDLDIAARIADTRRTRR